MSWPLSQDYNEAIQDPRNSFSDPELKTGEAATNALGIPMPRSGNFADVYEVRCPSGSRWAIKCFTREIHGLQERYAEISKYLRQANLPFMVDFQYLEQGIRIRGQWYPILKMQWVEGFVLNEFVRDNLDKKPVLHALGQIWLRMARRLRESYIAHCDLQHGNVMFVPGSTAKSLAVKLIDYDGMCVPSLAGTQSGEVGHPAYQHPERLRTGAYNQEVDRFSLLLVATALRCLTIGGRALWERYDTGDNLLFRQADLQSPKESPLFQELLAISDPQTQTLVKELYRACQGPLDAVPLLTDLLPEEKPAGKVTKTVAASSSAVPQQVAGVQGPDWDFGGEEPGAVVAKKRPASGGMPLWAWGAVGGAAALLLLTVGIGAALFLRKAPTEKDHTPVAQNTPDSKPVKQLPKPAENGEGHKPPRGNTNHPENGGQKPPEQVPAVPGQKGKRFFQLSPAGDRLAIANEADKTWRLVNPRTNETIREFREPSSAVTALAFSADGRVVASAHADKVLRLWDLQTGQMTNSVDTYSANVYNIALNPQGTVVACTDGGKRFPLTDLKARNDGVQSAPREVTCLAFSADGQALAVGLDNSDNNRDTVVVVYPQAAGLVSRSCIGRPSRVHCLAYSPDGKYLATGHVTGKAEVVVWNTTTGREVRRIEVAPMPRIHQVSFSPDSQMVLAASDQILGAWRIEDGKSLAQFSPSATDISFGTFSADSGQVQLVRVSGENVTVHPHLLPAGGVVAKPPELGTKSASGWDAPINPLRDCKFEDGAGKLTITLPSKGYDLSVENGQMTSPRMLRDVEGDFTAQVRVEGDFSARHIKAAGLLLMADENNYIRLERATWNRGPTAFWEIRQDGKKQNVEGYPAIPKDTVYLRLERRGDKVLGSHSTDGENWTERKAISVELPRKVKIGVAAVAPSEPFTVSFDQFRLKQGQGDFVRIDKWLAPADAKFAWEPPTDPDGDCKFKDTDGKLTITVPAKSHLLPVEGNGKNAPRLLFENEGDFTVQVRVGGDFTLAAATSDGGTYSWIGAGLLLWVDENTFLRLERAKWAGRPDWPSYANWEAREGGKLKGSKLNSKLNAAETYLRLERRGKQILASYSEDGEKWNSVTSLDIDLPAKVKIGVLAGSNTARVFAPTFDQFQLKQGNGELVRIDNWLMPTEADPPAKLTWDKPVDPDGDCKFDEAKGKLTLTVPGKRHDIRMDLGLNNAPRLLLNCEGDFTVQVRVGGDFSGSSFRGAGLLLWSGKNTYVRMERAVYAGNQFIVESMQDGKRMPPPPSPTLPAVEGYVRMERRGGKIFGAYSQDGRSWTEVAPVVMELPAKVKIGVAAISMSRTVFAPVFDQFQLKQGEGELARIDWPSLTGGGAVVKPPVNPPGPPVRRGQRKPRPEAAAVEAAIKDLRTNHKEAYASGKPGEVQRALVNELNAVRADPVKHFAILQELRDRSAESNVRGGLGHAQWLAREFDVDHVEMLCSVLETAARTGRQAHDVVEVGLPILDEAIGQENYEAIPRLVKVLRMSNNSERDATLRNTAERALVLAESVKKEHDKLKSSLATLQDNPDNTMANLAVGKFHCVWRGDWDDGLPRLARGGDAALKALAEKDLASPDDPDKQTALADEWIRYGSQVNSKSFKTACQKRACFWYQFAASQLKGSKQKTAEQRLKTLGRSVPELQNPWWQFGVPSGTRPDPATGYLRLQPSRNIVTQECYRGPLDISVTAQAMKTQLRIEIGQGGRLEIGEEFNRPGESLRVHRPDAPGSIGSRAVQKDVTLPANRLFTVRWQITAAGTKVWLDGKVIYEGDGNYERSEKEPVKISCDAEIQLKSILVKRPAEQ